MKFEKILLSFLLISAFILSGCSGNSPKDTVESMYDALSDGDYNALKETATSKSISVLMMGALLQCSAKKSDYKSDEEWSGACLQQVFGDVEIEDMEVTHQTQNNATVAVSYMTHGQAAKDEIHLIKEKEKWKVSLL